MRKDCAAHAHHLHITPLSAHIAFLLHISMHTVPSSKRCAQAWHNNPSSRTFTLPFHAHLFTASSLTPNDLTNRSSAEGSLAPVNCAQQGPQRPDEEVHAGWESKMRQNSGRLYPPPLRHATVSGPGYFCFTPHEKGMCHRYCTMLHASMSTHFQKPEKSDGEELAVLKFPSC